MQVDRELDVKGLNCPLPILRTKKALPEMVSGQLLQHRAQAEFYFLQGQLGPAIEQLEFAQKAKDGNFYELSAVDARLRELRKQHMEEEKKKRDGG